MQHDDSKRRSRWILRVMEWDEPKARYPNIWYDGMPSQLLLLNRVACRLRLGDLVAVYYPQSQQHKERSEKFVGLSRVTGLRAAQQANSAWVELETAHLLRKPLAVDPHPHRVFLCCDPGWPEPEVAMFRRVFDAAVSEGWRPVSGEAEPAGATASARPDQPAAEPVPLPAAEPTTDPDREPAADPTAASAADPAEPMGPVAVDASAEPRDSAAQTEPKPKPKAKPEPKPVSLPAKPAPGERTFAGADYDGDMRDPKDRTWLAILGYADERLRVIRLNPTGRAGLEASLRDPDTALMSAEAIGLSFPFALPLAFAESLLGGPFPEEGWWALVKRLERTTRPAFLEAVHEFRDAHGEVKRFADEFAQSLSPLHRGKRDVSPMTYHGVRMIGEDRSRYAIRPFESARGRLLLEVNPRVCARRLLAEAGEGKNRSALVDGLKSARFLPVDIDPAFARQCRDRPAALDAVIAARSAAVATLTGEADKTPDELAPGQGERIRREGWIYGLSEPS